VAERTVIRASHIIAYDGRGHRHLRDGVAVIEGNSILHVGKTWDGTAEHEIDATGHVVTPGLVNTHAHLTGSPLDKSLLEDRGPRQFYLSGLFEFLPVRSLAQDEEAHNAAADFSMTELIRSGTTTIMEIGTHGDYVAEAAGKAGLRAYVGQGYRSGAWFTPDGKTVRYRWDDDEGFGAMNKAIAHIEKISGTYDDRVRGFLTPMQVDTCTEGLLRRSREAANSMSVPLALHVSQSVNEFLEMVQRNGMTPIEWLESIGFLGPDCILGHCIIAGGGSWANYAADDIGILADTGAAVAHAVWVFARRGIAMESFSKYVRRGVTMTLATDTSPQNMIEALRYAAVVSKIVDRETELATAATAFDAATLGGSKALGRDDLGRIAPGAKADLLIWDAGTLNMSPLRDPVKNIVYNAAMEDLRTSIIDGRVVMQDGVPLYAKDPREAARALQAAGERMWGRFAQHDWQGRDVDTMSPQTYPAWDGA